LNASYRVDSSVGSFTPRVEVVYRGEQWARIFNTAVDKMKSYTIVNAGVEFLPEHLQNFRFVLTGTNLFDKDGVNSRFIDPYGTFQISDQYIPPRQVMATVAYKY
jgi:iron complex outermembrane recepter protein